MVLRKLKILILWLLYFNSFNQVAGFWVILLIKIELLSVVHHTGSQQNKHMTTALIFLPYILWSDTSLYNMHGRSKINNRGAIFIYSSSTLLTSFENEKNSFVFTVCEHEDMNIAHSPIIDLATAMTWIH